MQNPSNLSEYYNSMNTLEWKNCHADIFSQRYGLTIQAFLNDIITPAIHTLDKQLHELEKSDEPIAAFKHYDTSIVLLETKKAFALSIQSIWERSFRNYLQQCAKELRPNENLKSKIQKDDWKDLCKIFYKLREIKMKDFRSYDKLDLLHRLGNACRHGDGFSAKTIASQCRNWWPNDSPLPFKDNLSDSQKFTFSAVEIPTEVLVNFVEEVINFWSDIEFIYNSKLSKNI